MFQCSDNLSTKITLHYLLKKDVEKKITKNININQSISFIHINNQNHFITMPIKN